jgi:hypothetical protein
MLKPSVPGALAGGTEGGIEDARRQSDPSRLAAALQGPSYADGHLWRIIKLWSIAEMPDYDPGAQVPRAVRYAVLAAVECGP